MDNARAVTLYNKAPLGGIVQSSFCFERSALNYAREAGLSQFVIAVNGRVLHSHNVGNTYEFINGR
jgi:hypothetical protein